METFFKAIFGVGLVIGTVFIVGLLMAYPIMWAWNYVIPGVFGLRAITPMEGFCLYFLAGAFFKNSSSSKDRD